jgi:hypothetical protein
VSDYLDDLFARVEQAETSTEALPHRRKYLLLIMGFMRGLLELNLDLVEKVERELDPDEGGESPDGGRG